MSLRADDRAVLDRNDAAEIERVFGYELASCPDGKRCERDAEWGHPCPRDERSEYECERLTALSPAEIERRPFSSGSMTRLLAVRRLRAMRLDVLSALRVEFWTTRGHTYAQSQEART